MPTNPYEPSFLGLINANIVTLSQKVEGLECGVSEIRTLLAERLTRHEGRLDALEEKDSRRVAREDASFQAAKAGMWGVLSAVAPYLLGLLAIAFTLLHRT